jgi:hypothetical protein
MHVFFRSLNPDKPLYITINTHSYLYNVIYKLPLITNTRRSYCLSGFLSANER